jgi:hypothetical protein
VVPNLDADSVDGAHYSAGTWTPAFGGSGGQSGQAYTGTAGQYVKIGQLVFLSGRIVLTALGTITGNVQITGLPYPAASSSWGAITVGYHVNLTTAVVWLGGYADAGTSIISLLMKTAASTAAGGVAQSDLSDTTQIIFSAVYKTN